MCQVYALPPRTHTHSPLNIPPLPTHTGTSPYKLTGLVAPGEYRFAVTPQQISDTNLDKCASSTRGLIGQSIIIKL